jgi:broad specificity phosphatase PhoE
LKITLVRHGEVEKRYRKCYNGGIDIALSPKGYEDAKIIANKLSKNKYDAIYCSDLIRAKESIKQFGFDEKDIIFTNLLREKSWGKHEGLTFDTIIAQGEIKYKNFLQWINALDGEDYERYIQRVRDFFLEYLPSINKKNILVVTHAGD